MGRDGRAERFGGVTVTTLCSEMEVGKNMERQENPRTSLIVLMPHPLQFLDGPFHGRRCMEEGRLGRKSLATCGHTLARCE